MPHSVMKSLVSNETVRYAVNGAAATAVHYTVLRTALETMQLPSAGVANFIAALFGITASFLGSRWFVFRQLSKPIFHQATRFAVLYGLLACLHGVLLFMWTDVFSLNYSAGFAVAIVVQFLVSYPGNKYLVFAA